MKKASKKKPVVEAPKFHITVSTNGAVYEGQGATAYEALAAVPVPSKIINKGVVTITDGKKSNEFLYTAMRLRRLFFPNAQKILVKNLLFGMK